MIKRMWLLLLTTVALLVFTSCGPGTQASNSSGSGSEIVGVVQTTDETSRASMELFAVPDAKIFILKTDYTATGIESPETYSENDGSFSIPYAEPGRYLIEAFDSSDAGINSSIKMVTVSGDGEQVDAGAFNVVKPATLNCSINTSLPGDIEYAIYVLGTRVFGTGDENRLNLQLSNIPAGFEHTVQLKVTKPFPYTEEKKFTFSAGTQIDFQFTLADLGL